MQERNGVRVGQPVRDLDGTSLGRVTRLHEWGFEVRRGLSLFRRDFIARYDEVRGVRDGALILARSRRDLFDLAAGRLPPSWRVAAPPDFPSAATPGEARYVRADLARGAIPGEGRPPRGAPVTGSAPPVDEQARHPAAKEAKGASSRPRVRGEQFPTQSKAQFPTQSKGANEGGRDAARRGQLAVGQLAVPDPE